MNFSQACINGAQYVRESQVVEESKELRKKQLNETDS
jgi:hypothetical protein